MIGFRFKHLKRLRTSVNQPKSSGPRTPCMIGFRFKHLKRLKDEQYKHFIWRMHKLIMKILINSNTSLGCLHSKDVVLHVHLDLLENMLQCQLWRWYDKVLPNLALTFPKLDSLQCVQLYVTPGHQELKVLALRWYYNLASVSADNKRTGPSHFLSSLQSSPNFFVNCSSLSLRLNELVLDVGKPVSKWMTASTP